MSARSQVPLALKLGLVSGRTLLLFGAPEGFEAQLQPLPEHTRVTRAGVEPSLAPLGLALLFCVTQSQLKAQVPALVAKLHPDGMLWIAWPKRSAGVSTDVRENAVRATGLLAGVVDNKVCAIDDTWSGLRFQFRLQDRARREGALT